MSRDPDVADQQGRFPNRPPRARQAAPADPQDQAFFIATPGRVEKGKSGEWAVAASRPSPPITPSATPSLVTNVSSPGRRRTGPTIDGGVTAREHPGVVADAPPRLCSS